MKSLTIDELKALEVGDWVWIVSPMYMRGRYLQVHYNGVNTIQWYGIPNDTLYMYDDYGKTWLAFKNKEQAEAKGEIVELPCRWGDTVYFIDHKWGKDKFEWVDVKSDKFDWEAMRNWNCLFFATREEAERRLAELRGEK